MEKTGTLPQERRVTRKTIVENSAQESHKKIAISEIAMQTQLHVAIDVGSQLHRVAIGWNEGEPGWMR